MNKVYLATIGGRKFLIVEGSMVVPLDDIVRVNLNATGKVVSIWLTNGQGLKFENDEAIAVRAFFTRPIDVSVRGLTKKLPTKELLELADATNDELKERGVLP